MFLLKEMKKIKTYFNGLLPTGSRDQYNIRFTLSGNGIGSELLAVMQIGGNTVKITTNSVTEVNTTEAITNCVVPFEQFYDELGKIKGVKEVDLIKEGNNLFFKTEEEKFPMECTEIVTREFEGEKLAEVFVEEMSYAFSLNTSTTKTGVSDFDNNIVMLSKENKLFLGSYTIGAFVGNELSNRINYNFSCIIPYSNSAFMKKWLKYASNPKNILEDILEISVMNTFVEMKIANISIIVQVDIEDKISEVFNGIFANNYEKEKELDFEEIRRLVTEANKDKKQEIELDNLGINASLYRPLLSDIVYQLSETDFDIEVNQIKSKFDTLIFETNSIYDTKTKILTFFKTK